MKWKLTILMVVMVLLSSYFVSAATNGVPWVRPANQNITQIVYNATNNTYVKIAGETSNVHLTPIDGIETNLFSAITTGTNQYGIEIGTYDLTGVAYGKYPYLIPVTNGAIANLMLSGPILIGSSYPAGGGIGQAFGFVNDITAANMRINSEWDWDGLGNNRMSFNDDVIFTQNADVSGILSLSSLSIGKNIETRPAITFDALNYDGTLTFSDGADLQPVGYYFGDASLTNTLLSLPGHRIQINNGGMGSYHFLDLNYGTVEGVQARMYYSGYVGELETTDSTAHYFTATGTQLPDDGWFTRFFHMGTPGYIFGVKPYGDLEIGSELSDPSGLNTFDKNVTLRMKGNNSNMTMRYMDDINTTEIDKHLAILGNIYANNICYSNGTNCLINSSITENISIISDLIIGNSSLKDHNTSITFLGNNSNLTMSWWDDAQRITLANATNGSVDLWGIRSMKSTSIITGAITASSMASTGAVSGTTFSGTTSTWTGTAQYSMTTLMNRTQSAYRLVNPFRANLTEQFQNSPVTEWIGSAWDTGTAGSKSFNFSTGVRVIAGNPATAVLQTIVNINSSNNAVPKQNISIMNITSDGNVEVLKNITAGNFITGDGYYAGMYFHNDTGISFPITSDYQNISIFQSNYSSSHMNGFSMVGNNSIRLDDARGNGMYQVIYHASGSGVNNHDYHTAVFIDDVKQLNTNSHTTAEASNQADINGIGFIRLYAGNITTLRIRDTTSSTGTIYIANINLVRVGN